jgi:hypothetical protein
MALAYKGTSLSVIHPTNRPKSPTWKVSQLWVSRSRTLKLTSDLRPSHPVLPDISNKLPITSIPCQHVSESRIVSGSLCGITRISIHGFQGRFLGRVTPVSGMLISQPSLLILLLLVCWAGLLHRRQWYPVRRALRRQLLLLSRQLLQNPALKQPPRRPQRHRRAL